MQQKMTDLFNYLSKLELAHQVHFRNNDEFVFYHWNRNMTDLEVSVVIKHGKIERVEYNRSVIPRVYLMMNDDFTNDFTEEHKFTRDKRAK